MRSRPTVPTRKLGKSWRSRGAARVLLVLCALAVGLSPTARAATQTGPPPGLPGPPPGAGAGLAAAPSAGIVPPAGVVGAPTTLPAHVSGPALLSGVVRVHGLRLTLAIACATAAARVRDRVGDPAGCTHTGEIRVSKSTRQPAAPAPPSRRETPGGARPDPGRGGVGARLGDRSAVTYAPDNCGATQLLERWRVGVQPARLVSSVSRRT